MYNLLFIMLAAIRTIALWEAKVWRVNNKVVDEASVAYKVSTDKIFIAIQLTIIFAAD